MYNTYTLYAKHPEFNMEVETPFYEICWILQKHDPAHEGRWQNDRRAFCMPSKKKYFRPEIMFILYRLESKIKSFMS